MKTIKLNKTSNQTQYLGVDISKKTLDLSQTLPHSKSKVENSLKEIKSFIKELESYENIHVVFEATGGYEFYLIAVLEQKNINYSLVNPRQIRDFAKAAGILAKTDKMDAKVIAFYAERMEPKPSTKTNKESLILRELLEYREHLLDGLHREKMALEHPKSSAITQLIKSQITTLERRLKKVETLLKTHLKTSDYLQETYALLEGVSGVGVITALGLLAYVPELGKLNRNQIAALIGLAPLNKDSGTLERKRVISGGRGKIRKNLYMATLTATRYNEVIKAHYESLLKRGKEKKVALVACARKLLTYLNSLMRTHLSSSEEDDNNLEKA